MVHLRQFLQHPSARATGIIFALCGFIFGTWASLIPYVKEKFVLDEAELGLLLLCLPAGNLIANPISVMLISRWGAVRVSLYSIMAMGIGFTLPILLPSLFLVGAGMIVAGATFAFTNVAMNTCASYLEQEVRLQIMSACHGMWSLGAMIGSLVSGGAILGLKFLAQGRIDAYPIYMLMLVIFVLWITWYVHRDLLLIHEGSHQKEEEPVSGTSMLRPNRMLWILISICLCTFLTEGTMADWSAVYLRQVTLAPEAIAGWGFAVYAFFQASGRFVGDLMISRHGSMQMLRIGGVLVIAGLVVIVLSATPWLALPGFMLTGLGISLASPILYAEAARVPDMPRGAGLATMNTFGMAAFLGGPVLIGFVAELSDLRIAFICVILSAVIWVLQTSLIIRRKRSIPSS